MRLGPAFLALGGLATIAAGCQTSSTGRASSNEARIIAAGFTSQGTQSVANPLSPATTVRIDSVYICEADKCGSRVALIQFSMPSSNGMFGMTTEEAVRKKLLKNSTWEDILSACLKSLQRNVKISKFSQFANDLEVGAEFELVGTDDNNRTIYGSGRFTFKGNLGDVAAAMSADRSLAKRSLGLLAGK